MEWGEVQWSGVQWWWGVEWSTVVLWLWWLLFCWLLAISTCRNSRLSSDEQNGHKHEQGKHRRD